MSAPAFRHRWADFAGLGPDDLYDLLALRCAVFVVEQACAYADIDGRDRAALHLLAWLPGEAALAGTLRVFPPRVFPGVDGTPARIGRVATARHARGCGLGAFMMREALAEVARRFGPVAVELDAQVGSEAFYAKLGFRRVSEDYDEDGIAHCTMRRSAGSLEPAYTRNAEQH